MYGIAEESVEAVISAMHEQGLCDEKGEIVDGYDKTARFEANGLEEGHTFIVRTLPKPDKFIPRGETSSKMYTSICLYDLDAGRTVKVGLKALFSNALPVKNAFESGANALPEMFVAVYNNKTSKKVKLISKVREIQGRFIGTVYTWETSDIEKNPTTKEGEA